jgi:hypothetical protein
VTYSWFGSPTNEYTVSIYSKFKDVKITDIIRSTNMVNMDGSIPSGFKNSTYCGMNCPSKYSPNTIVDYSKVKVRSLVDLFSKASDIYSLLSLLWYNLWVLIVWFN